MRKREVKDSMTAAAGHVCGSVNVWLDDPHYLAAVCYLYGPCWSVLVYSRLCCIE